MSHFTPYVEPSVPTAVLNLEIGVNSKLVTVYDPETDEPIGYDTIENIAARATVIDQNGEVVHIHEALTAQELLDKNVFNAEQLLAIQQWLRTVRFTIETLVLPQG